MQIKNKNRLKATSQHTTLCTAQKGSKSILCKQSFLKDNKPYLICIHTLRYLELQLYRSVGLKATLKLNRVSAQNKKKNFQPKSAKYFSEMIIHNLIKQAYSELCKRRSA